MDPCSEEGHAPFDAHSRASVALDRFAGALAELLRAVLE